MSGIESVMLAVLFAAAGMFAMLFIAHEDITMGWEAYQLIEQCQQDLPRNQYCTIKAVVAEEKL